MSRVETLLELHARLRAAAFTLLVRGSFYEFGKGSRIMPPMRFGRLGRIRLGDRVLIAGGCWIQVIDECVDGSWPIVTLGNDVRISMDVTISASASVIIEDHAAIGRNSFVSDHGHEFHDPDVPVILQGIRKVAAVRIGPGAWLGHGVVVLPGVTIGCNAVIGANSVVRSDIPDHCVAVGAPARVVSRYDTRSSRWEAVDSA